MIRLLITLCITASLNIFATNYFIDSENGDDLNFGTSEKEAWKSILQVNITPFAPGDNIYFKRGDLWREHLQIFSSGTEGNNITISAYGEGARPVISGAVEINDFVQHSEIIWRVPLAILPQQVFFDNVRGIRKTSLASLEIENDWYFNSAEKFLYIVSGITNPDSKFIEITSRSNTISVNANNIVIENLQLEKTSNSLIKISSASKNIVVDDIEFFQWSIHHEGENAAVEAAGENIEVKNCTLGKNTGNEIADQNWSGFAGIYANGRNVSIYNNKIFNNSTENETVRGIFTHGIRLMNFSGTIRVFNNYIYHTGSHGIFVGGYSNQGDSVFIYNNIIEYPGQAGISAYKTRADDGIGAIGYVFRNKVSFANRLGGDVGANGSQASGIHMNDGIRLNTEPEKPYIKWYVYENIVHSSQAHADSNSQDSGGINADYNANGVEIYRNLVYDNWGKGITLWNSNNCKVYYNIIYGNDAGTIVTAANNSIESADNNEIYNNTYYKNFNGYNVGPNYNTEIYFGKNGQNTKIQNNIFYASDVGYAYFYDTTNTTGIVLNHNLIFKDVGTIIAYDSKNRSQIYQKWLENHPEWDINSINEDPGILVASENFDIFGESPAIDRALNIGQEADFKKNPIINLPDIGAIEFPGISKVDDEKLPVEFILYQNYPNPFNPNTTIKFSISSLAPFYKTTGLNRFVSLTVYDPLGKKVTQLINEELPPGEHEIVFNADGLASGVYYYKLTIAGNSKTSKMILLR